MPQESPGDTHGKAGGPGGVITTLSFVTAQILLVKSTARNNQVAK